MIKCENCGKEVVPTKKKFSVLFFLLCLISVILTPVAIIYLIIHLCRRNDHCPYCNKTAYKKTLNNKINDKLMTSGNPTFLYIIYGLIAIFMIAIIISIINDIPK